MAEVEKCENCVYWTIGKCRRYPPIALIKETGWVVDFVPVAPAAWCGDWKKKA